MWFSVEIETAHARNDEPTLHPGWRGMWFSVEIETQWYWFRPGRPVSVGEGCGSRLRLKLLEDVQRPQIEVRLERDVVLG